MPRPRRPGAPEPKRRSRKGCWPCKARKVKCGEEKPACLNCQRQGDPCDYSVRLNWGGRTKRMSIDSPNSQSSGYGGAVIGFSDSFAINDLSPVSFPTPASNNPADGFINTHPGELTSPRAISPSTSSQMGLFESPRLGSDSEGVLSPGQLESRFSSTWAEQSPPLTASATSAPLLQYQFGQHSFDSPSYLGSIDQTSGLRSLSAFAFHTNPVSQPVSYMRHPVDVSNHCSGPSISHSRDEEHLSQGSYDDRGMHLGARSRTGQNRSSNSPQDTTGLMLFDPRRVSIAESDAISSPRLHETTSNMGSVHDYHNGLTPDHQALAESNHEADQTSHESSIARSKWQTYLNSVTDNYGLDSGRPDQDLTFNNDHAAIDINYALDLISSRWRNEESKASQPDPVPQVQFCSGYYASPVPINVPRYLSPLPSSLLENPINLMYFHHFLNHTARMLVPHNCDNNPFISVLPSMAIGDSNLLNLLLAYSASHRARYLGHPEPANRIAHWVSKVFPTLRMALESSKEDITDSHLATAIMLLSLKIVSPRTFEVPITWKSHLKLARDLFLARSEGMAHPGNRIGAFFARWLGYLDTMGSLSCRQAGPPLMIYHSILTACSAPDGHDEFGVDCFTGFTPRTGVFLIRLAQLVQECDNQLFDEMGNFRHDWHASAEMVLEAQSVLGVVDGISERAHTSPEHHHGVESSDMIAIEEAFRFAGLLHLHRRVLGSPRDSFPVKEVLRKLIDALGRMRPGAATEVCSLFPLFTAGCESRDPVQRSQLLDRFFVLESSGMKQIQNARQLMQHCWDEDLPWVALASGQFLG
ncbi:transcriptional regulator family: Fungal Specific TF [Penicillium roqueforti]|nr:transcriptional regulator family: Fungal Specific TF [Penicillium roqueforti]KAI2699798.1 transcriptional regulator family: Fungal Specific TF [Penicillium roqueforti]KAI2710281.1 transcriptional regulator family: Fungal Specific TF [Penicillium roqueforti]KAI2727100.1 transcriptional regulator family: Fungal Specific TF [Penicillium roqueforti]KAI2757996.1 transcriptional regulator family: Fungal Specific TF [Penicillium roqueforti]